MGLDPSKTGLGWSIISPSTEEILDYGMCPVILDEAKGEFLQIIDLAIQVGAIVAKYKPVAVASERAFTGKNAAMTSLLDRLVGAIACEVWRASDQSVLVKTYPTFTWHKLVGLKPDEYLTGKLTKKTKKPEKRLDFKAPAIRMVLGRWPKCQEEVGKPLIEAAADATLVAQAGLIEHLRSLSAATV